MGFDLLSPAVQRFAIVLVRRKALQLCRRSGFSRFDRQDLEQDLLHHLLTQLSHYDASKGTPFAFITAVVERKVATVLKQLRAAKRNGAYCSSLDHSEEDIRDLDSLPDPTSCANSGSQAATERALDVSEVLAQLPPDLLELCQQLKTVSLLDASRNLGIPPSTLRYRLQQIRAHFEKFGMCKNI